MTVSLPSINEILRNKDLWKVVLYSSLLEFFGKIRLKEFFEAREIKQEKRLRRLDKLSLNPVRETLKDLQLIEQTICERIGDVQKVRNEFVHNILLSSILFDEDKAEKAAAYAKRCISALSTST